MSGHFRDYEIGKPRAAVGTFPYPHRTLAQFATQRLHCRETVDMIGVGAPAGRAVASDRRAITTDDALGHAGVEA